MVASVAPDLNDPTYKSAIVDLLGAIGYGEISAVERLTEDSGKAPTLSDKVALLGMAHAQYAKVEPIRARLESMGVDPFAAMEPFRDPIDAFHEYTQPSNWWESLVKASVGDSLVRDFYREFAVHLDDETRTLIESTLEDDRNEFLVERVRAGIAADPLLGGRLALWGRRIMGEALTQTQHVAVERQALAQIMTGELAIAGLDLASISEMFQRITARHIGRMTALGLAH